MLVAWACACGATSTRPEIAPIAPVASASSDAPPPRRPDGVVLEPAPDVPPAVPTAEARGVVALRPTLSVEAIDDCVRELLEAWQDGSYDRLFALLTTDAGPIEARARGPGALGEAWRARLRAHEYKRLEGLELAQIDHVQHYAYAELGSEGAPARPADMRPDEVLLRVPLDVTQVAGEKFFEGTIVLLVRSEGGKARITAYGETP